MSLAFLVIISNCYSQDSLVYWLVIAIIIQFDIFLKSPQ